MKAETKSGVDAAATSKTSEGMPIRLSHRQSYMVECYGPDGGLKWIDSVHNLTVNTGLDDILSKYWKGSTYTAAHYVGLLSGTPTIAAGNTSAVHAGWTEITDYSESVRQTLTLGSVSGQSVSNTASKAVFSINGPATVGGAFVSTDSTKADTLGILIGAGAFSGGNRSVISGDTLSVTVTITEASA